MGSTANEVLGSVLCFVGLVGLVVSTSANEWKVTTRGTAVITASWIYQGLWRSCAGNAMGSVTCKGFYTIMGVPLHLKVCQALMVVSVVLGNVGTLVALVGIKSSRLGSARRLKARIMASSGAIYLLAGLSAMTATSFYAHRITLDFYNPNLVGARYEYGWCVYLSWASSTLCIIGAVIKCSTCYGVKDETPDMMLQQQQQPRYSTAPTEFTMAADYSGLAHRDQQPHDLRKDSTYSMGGIPPADPRKMSLFSTATEAGMGRAGGGPRGGVWGAPSGRRASDAALLDVDRAGGPGDSPRRARRGSAMSYGRNAYV